MNVTKVLTKEYENIRPRSRGKNKPKQTQFHPPFHVLSKRTNHQLPKTYPPETSIFPAQRPNHTAYRQNFLALNVYIC
jgi:hypothetical protein